MAYEQYQLLHIFAVQSIDRPGVSEKWCSLNYIAPFDGLDVLLQPTTRSIQAEVQGTYC